MKNKITIILLVLSLLYGSAYAEEKDPNKLLSGVILTLAGGLVAYSGLRMAEISYPAMKMQAFTWNKTAASDWDVTAFGTVKNTGNQELRDITVTVEYKNSIGTIIASETVNLDTKSALLLAGETDDFSSALIGLAIEPVFISAKFHADYTREYQTYSPEIGIAGAVIAAAGIFFIIDYAFDLTDFLESKDVKVQLSSSYSGFNLMTSKSF